MKQAITPNYTFTPASKQVDLSSVSNFDIKKLYAIINVTANQIIYAVGQSSLGLASEAAGVVTLIFDTTSMNAADELLILYDNQGQNTSSTSDPVVLSSEQELILDAIKTAVENLDLDVDGVATEVTLASLLTSFNNEDFATEATLSLLNSKLNTLGQKASVDSAPVVLSSEQEIIFDAIKTAVETVAADNATETTLELIRLLAVSIDSKLNTLGQKASVDSVPVVLSSEQQALIESSNNIQQSSNDIQKSIDEILNIWRPNHDEILSELKSIQDLILLSQNDEVQIKGGTGKGIISKVNEFGALKVVDQGIPDTDDPTISVPFTDFLFNDLGSNSLVVNGSVTSVDFTINSESDADRFISQLSFAIADVGAQLNEFGGLAQLANGIQIIYFNDELGENILANNITTNFELIRVCGGYPAFGDAAAVFQAPNAVGAQGEAYIPILRFKEQFGLPFGLRLRKGKRDKVIIRVRDNLAGLDVFNVLSFGIRKIK